MNGRKPRIGVLANTLEDGAGTEAGGLVHFLEVVKRWPWAEVVIFAPEEGRDAFTRRVPGAHFIAMPSWRRLARAKAPLFVFRALFGVLRYRELRACDALVATSQALPDTVPAALARGKRTMAIVHHIMQRAGRRDGPFLRNAVAFAAERLSLALVARTFGAVCCSSRLVASELRALGFRIPIAITTSGVDHMPAASPGGVRQGVAYVGRVHPTKGIDDLVRAWRLVVDRLPDKVLTCIGATDDPAFERELDVLIADLGLTQSVRKLGRVPDDVKVAVLHASSAFAFASKEEGWGIAVAEAMRAGLPCVTYDLPIFAEIFPQGRLAAPAGDVTSLAACLVRLLSDDALRGRLAREAAHLADTFSWQRAAEIEGDAVLGVIPGQADFVRIAQSVPRRP